VLENEITVLRFSEVGVGVYLVLTPMHGLGPKVGGWTFTRYWVDTRYFTVLSNF